MLMVRNDACVGRGHRSTGPRGPGRPAGAGLGAADGAGRGEGWNEGAGLGVGRCAGATLGAGDGAGANCDAVGAGRVCTFWRMLAEGAGAAGRKVSWRKAGGAEGAGATEGFAAGREGTLAFGMTMGREIGAADCGGADCTEGPGIDALGVGFAGITDGREVVTGVGRDPDSNPDPDRAVGIREADPGLGAPRGEAGSVGTARGMGTLRDSGGREGVTLGVGVVGLVGVVDVVGVVDGFPKTFGATAVGVLPPLPGRVVGGSVWVNRSVGLLVGRGAGRPGDDEGATLADGMLAGRFGLSEPLADGTVSGREFSGEMPMRSGRPPEFGVGANRETSGRLRTDSGGREAWVGTAGRYTATSAGRPPEGLGRELAKA